MRIDGLVSASRRVRQALKRGIPEEEREEFRSWVREMVFQVEDICDRYGATPDDLPRPSREAWRFLKNLDLSRLPGPPPGAPPPSPRVRIPGIVSRAEKIANWLWSDQAGFRDDERARDQVREEAAWIADRVVELAEDLEGRPSGLPPRSRSAYALLRWLSIPGNAARYLRTLEEAEETVRSATEVLTVIRIFPASSSFSILDREGWQILRLHPGFLAADEIAWNALERALADPKARAATGWLRRFLRSAPVAAVLAEFDLAVG